MNELWGELLQAVQQFHKLGIAELNPELTQAEGMALMAIDRFNNENAPESITVSELAKMLHCQSSAVSRTLKALEDERLVKRMVNQCDRRNIHVVLSQKGKEQCEKVKTVLDSFTERVIVRMGKANIKKIVAGMNQLNQVANEELQIWKQSDGFCFAVNGNAEDKQE